MQCGLTVQQQHVTVAQMTQNLLIGCVSGRVGAGREQLLGDALSLHSVGRTETDRASVLHFHEASTTQYRVKITIDRFVESFTNTLIKI